MKKKHYSYLKDVYPIYEPYWDEMKKLSSMTDAQLQAIINKNTNATPYPLWWQNVKL